MTYPDLDSFRNALFHYLLSEKAYLEEDIKNNEALPDNQKVENGFLIKKATVVKSKHPYYELSVSENNTKLRPGDNAILVCNGGIIKARVIENTENLLTIETSSTLSENESYKVEVRESVFLDPLIALAEKIEDGAPGSYWLELLAGLAEPESMGYRSIDTTAVDLIPKTMNQAQRHSCEAVAKRPSVYCLQGPPGTGKTDVLATMANIYNSSGHDVLILSNTHQAVNNALNKVKSVNPNLNVVKVGEELKGEGLNSEIRKANTYNEYIGSRNSRRRRKDTADIVGMTFHAGVVNLGLRSTGFLPSIILVDEAGQMPFVQGALIGGFGSSTIVLIGDDLQMPPIFHEKLADDPLSTSIFSHLCRIYPEQKGILTTTYRLNRQITDLINRKFYQPNGITLEASEFSANRMLELNANSEDERIDNILRRLFN